MKYIFLFFFLNQINFVYSTIPNWNLQDQGIDLLGSGSNTEFTLYEKNFNDLNVTLKKIITKNDNKITTENIIYIGTEFREVEFNDIDSQYKDKLGCGILICPKGKFHPYDFNNNQYLNIPNFQDEGNWDLRCYDHYTGYFLIIYLSNFGKNFFYKFSGNSIEEYNQYGSYIYDFKLQNKDGEQPNDYEYKFSQLYLEGDYLKLKGEVLILNSANSQIQRNNFANFGLVLGKTYSRATFDNNHKFYFLTYNSATDFTSGYSESYVDFSDKAPYISSVNNPVIVKTDVPPFSFVDNVEIEDINFIMGTNYAYYKINNLDKDKTYYGLIDVVENKVLYNIDDNITLFIPISTTTEMLAITPTSAYKICIIKSDNACLNSCENLMLNPEGNKCQSGCDSNQVKLMPEGICIKKNLCDTNYYTLNSDETECGLCSYFNPYGNKFKLINTTGCISPIPNNAEYYNEKLFLLKCKSNYQPNSNNECVIACFERCATCNEIGNDITAQKCSSCKEGYTLDNGNCIVPPTTIINPPPTIIKLQPTTDMISPTTITIPPTTEITPITTVTIPPTTISPIPTTIIIEVPTEEKILETCSNNKCKTCNEESNKDGLCLSCDESVYKKVNYTYKYSKYFNCIKEKDLEFKYYKDFETNQYKPCFKLCKKCLGPGNATHHNCLECVSNYMFRPGPNPYNNCVVYSEYYYQSAYGEYKALNSPLCPEEAKYKIKDENNKTSCIYDCKVDKIYKYLYNGHCVKQCPNNTNETDFICQEDPKDIYISEDTLYQDLNFTLENIEVLAEAYAYEFYYTDNHVSTYQNSGTEILIYKNPDIIAQTNLKAPKIDFGECYQLIKKAYNITGDLITAIVDKKVKNNPSTFYSFFHPETGKKLDTNEICKNKNIKVEENLLNLLDEKSKNYELQKSLTEQGINIFDINDPYYKDICYDFHNPKKRDISLKDRIKETYVNASLCDDGCVNTGIDVKNNVATCDCKFNVITNNDLIHENAALEYLVGEIFDFVNSSNILVLKCYKYVLKYFIRSKGGMIILTILILSIIFTFIFFSYGLIKMKRYIFTLTEKYSIFLANYSNLMKSFPPKKSIKNKTKKEFELKMPKDGSQKNKKQSSVKTMNLNFNLNFPNFKKSSKDTIISLNKKNSQLFPLKEKQVINGITIYNEEIKRMKKYFKDYLSTSVDEMEFDDAINYDKRDFCKYLVDTLKQKQNIAYTFIASDPINTRMIKFFLFLLNLDLYFVVNGLFFSEAFISELYHTNEKEENFFSFIPRNIDKVFYTTIVSLFIGYMTDFFFIRENKIKGIFKREKDNRTILKRSIAMLIKEIQNRYISFIIMTFVLLVISLYYVLCFNYVYPKTQKEWIKSSILIIIIMQILSVLRCLYETIFRTLAFKCESEKLYKIGKIFENNS